MREAASKRESFMESYETQSLLQYAAFAEPLKVIVFDCDGVLFDSRQANRRFYNHLLARFGRPPVRPDQEEYIYMHSAQESVRFLLDDELLIKEAQEYCRQMDFSVFNSFLSCEPGLVDVLKLAKTSFHTALATNRAVSTHRLLADFGLDVYFDLVVCAADVRYPKPHPEIMERILDAFRASPREILYVGDSAVDEALAAATGVFFAAYKNPRLVAHMHISHFRELHAVLSSESARK